MLEFQKSLIHDKFPEDDSEATSIIMTVTPPTLGLKFDL